MKIYDLNEFRQKKNVSKPSAPLVKNLLQDEDFIKSLAKIQNLLNKAKEKISTNSW